MTGRRPLTLLLAAAALLTPSCAPSDTVTVQGAGATFPAPLSKRWFLEYNLAHPNVRVNYQAVGSGAGVSQLQAGLTDFAESDEALSKAKLAEVGKAIGERDGTAVELMQVPITGGAVALCYNLPGHPDLKLPRLVYAGMALGEITFWDDAALAAANPGVALPHLPITFVRRAESSGTTFVFTTHLNAIDDRWKLDAVVIDLFSRLVDGRDDDEPAGGGRSVDGGSGPPAGCGFRGPLGLREPVRGRAPSAGAE